MDEDSDAYDGDLNPEVQYQLETLNTTSLQINELENQLEDLRKIYQISTKKWIDHLSDLSSKVGSAIPKARPYFDLKRNLIEVQNESQFLAAKYEKACDIITNCKARIAKAEAAPQLDDSSMEIMNKSTQCMLNARQEKEKSQNEHANCLDKYINLSKQLVELEKKHKNDIKKSKHYFNYSKCMEDQLKEEKMRIEVHEDKVKICKSLYNSSLNKLEEISERIHRERSQKTQLGPRQEAVGAESSSMEVSECGDIPSITMTTKLDDKTFTESRKTNYKPRPMNAIVNRRISSSKQSNQLKKKPQSSYANSGISTTPIIDGLLKQASYAKRHYTDHFNNNEVVNQKYSTPSSNSSKSNFQ